MAAFLNLAPKQSQWWVSVPKVVVKNGHFQPVFGHFVLKIQDGGRYAELVFANGAIGFSQSMRHQWDASEAFLSHVASRGTTLWSFGCQNQPY